MKRIVTIVALSLLGLFVLIQLVPYGRDHAAGAVTAEPTWDSPRTRQLVRAACFDCHSNETAWPWYTSVAPFSWLTQRDVDEGRDTLNFSEWDRPQGEVEDLGEVVLEGEMPPWYYSLLHGGAKLTDAEKRELADGLEATLRASPPVGGESSEGGEGSEEGE